MRRKIEKYLCKKQGVESEKDIKYLADGRFDFEGDIEGVLEAVRGKDSNRRSKKKKAKDGDDGTHNGADSNNGAASAAAAGSATGNAAATGKRGKKKNSTSSSGGGDKKGPGELYIFGNGKNDEIPSIFDAKSHLMLSPSPPGNSKFVGFDVANWENSGDTSNIMSLTAATTGKSKKSKKGRSQGRKNGKDAKKSPTSELAAAQQVHFSEDITALPFSPAIAFSPGPGLNSASNLSKTLSIGISPFISTTPYNLRTTPARTSLGSHHRTPSNGGKVPSQDLTKVFGSGGMTPLVPGVARTPMSSTLKKILLNTNTPIDRASGSAQINMSQENGLFSPALSDISVGGLFEETEKEMKREGLTDAAMTATSTEPSKATTMATIMTTATKTSSSSSSSSSSSAAAAAAAAAANGAGSMSLTTNLTKDQSNSQNGLASSPHKSQEVDELTCSKLSTISENNNNEFHQTQCSVSSSLLHASPLPPQPSMSEMCASQVSALSSSYHPESSAATLRMSLSSSDVIISAEQLLSQEENCGQGVSTKTPKMLQGPVVSGYTPVTGGRYGKGGRRRDSVRLNVKDLMSPEMAGGKMKKGNSGKKRKFNPVVSKESGLV